MPETTKSNLYLSLTLGARQLACWSAPIWLKSLVYFIPSAVWEYVLKIGLAVTPWLWFLEFLLFVLISWVVVSVPKIAIYLAGLALALIAQNLFVLALGGNSLNQAFNRGALRDVTNSFAINQVFWLTGAYVLAKFGKDA